MNIYYISIACAIIFFAITLLESKFILKEKNIQIKKNLKYSIIVFIIIILVYNVYSKFPINESVTNGSPNVFLNTPDF